LSFQFTDLSGKGVVLTGAARGIGRALSAGLARQGMRLVLLDQDSKGLSETADALRANGVKVETLVCDLADSQQRLEACRAIADLSSDLYGIVHNAAIDPRIPLEQMSVDLFRQIMATNVEPAVDMTKQLLPQLRRNGATGARVILIGSIMFEAGGALMSAYVAAKGAIVGLTRSLAHELGPQGITVNCISPGAIQVDREQEIPSPELDDLIIRWQSVKRRLVPEDLLGITCLLLSSAGSGINGQVIHVDGGLMHPIADADFQRPLIRATPS
jgi:NAD(P)-dependent dehydrogenase (short-subunit alcohol dehydrogenase family)